MTPKIVCPSPLATDPIAFARQRLGFFPDPPQERVLRPGTRRGLLNCIRQWGSPPSSPSTRSIMPSRNPSAWSSCALHPGAQSREFCRKVLEFLHELSEIKQGEPRMAPRDEDAMDGILTNNLMPLEVRGFPLFHRTHRFKTSAAANL